MKPDQPATIPVAAAAFVASIGPALGYFLAIDAAGTVILSTLINGAGALALAFYLNKTTTSSAAPVVESGTEVAIKGSDDTVIAQPTPPGPIGVEDGAVEAGG